MKIRAGTLLTIEFGEYSDFSYAGPFRVLKDFDQAGISEEYRRHWQNESPDKDISSFLNDSERKFVSWLAREGFVEDADSVSWHVGSSGFDPDIDPEPVDEGG